MPKPVPISPPPDWPATTESRWAKPLSRLVLFLLTRYQVIGRENIPDPPFLLVSNHMSFFDIPAVNYPAPHGTVGFAARKYIGTKYEPLFRLYPVIWIEQFSADRGALRDAITVLEAGVPLGIAPEGTRSKVGALIQGRGGAAFVATRTGVPIVPACTWGTEKVLKHPRPKVIARYGKPFHLPAGRAKGDALEEYTERIMCAIAALLPEKYHGYYAGNPLIEEMRRIVT
ncbi:MAG: 1-acyl-sn-glycerol-3-phosphate acyltransferase [Anaerolineae bacterium]|nr:1-acyl-sn-glycerol-3-phosphate acyltransferase [Anaerolineae bacterium]